MVKILHFTSRRAGSVPSQEMRIPHAGQCGQKFFVFKIILKEN